jgi:polar amino acid transport system substrate-binding protein
MKKVYTCFLMTVLLLASVTFVGILAACGADEATDQSSRSPETTSAADTAQQVLGKAPSGLAATIIRRGSVLVSTIANHAPQSSVNKDSGELEGFDIDVAKAVGEKLGLEIEFEAVPWSAVIPGLRAGKWDVSIGSMAVTEEHMKTIDFAEPYYYVSGQVFVKKGGQQISGADDLAGESVGVCAASTYHDWLKQNTEADVKTYTTDADAFRHLRDGDLDFVMTEGSTGQQAILEGEPLEFSGPPMLYEDLAFATKQGQADWLALLDYSVRQMHEDGTLTKISKKWFGGSDLTVKAF